MGLLHVVVGTLNCIFSIIMLIIGLILIAIVVLLKYAEENYIKDNLAIAKTKTKEAVKFVPDFFPPSYRNFEFPEADVFELLHNIMVALIMFGVICVVVGVFGCYITRHTKRLCVGIYTAVLIALTLALGLTFHHFDDLTKVSMYGYLEEYSGLADDSLKGLTWTAIMVGFQCCGVEGYEDFEELKNWPPKDLKDHTFNATKLWDSLGWLRKQLPNNGMLKTSSPLDDVIDQKKEHLKDLNEHLNEETKKIGCIFGENQEINCNWLDPDNFKTPMACCKSFESLAKRCYVKGYANDENNWMSQGCYKRFSDIILSQENMIYLISVIVISFLVVYSVLLIIRLIVGAVDKPEK